MCFDRRSGGGVRAAWVFGSARGPMDGATLLTIKGDEMREGSEEKSKN